MSSCGAGARGREPHRRDNRCRGARVPGSGDARNAGRAGHVSDREARAREGSKHARRSRQIRQQPLRGWGRNPWLIALMVSIATLMLVLDTSIANVGLR
jgi:hypothetical protein